DGDLDIVTNEFNAGPQVLISNLAQKKAIHYLKVVLSGRVSNRQGLGAAVTVTAGGRSHTKYNDGKSGYLSQSALPLYFGLGDATAVEKVEVRWPSGRRSTIDRGVPINQTLTVTEPR
ncbi:MAG TPA: ASPIC/UnbV domain-containing protein, partial [Thermoanaerobaculia bacterium]|nr:ASPIC/UnbV domain-containing protein [Thermoanaerobaculia bacterium]